MSECVRKRIKRQQDKNEQIYTRGPSINTSALPIVSDDIYALEIRICSLYVTTFYANHNK